MNIAKVRIKGIDGDLSPEKTFNTDILNLKKGDMVLVFKDKGIELAIFEGYSERNVGTTGFVIDKVSGDRVEQRLKEQRELFALASGEPEGVLRLEDSYNDNRGKEAVEEKPKEKPKKVKYTAEEIWGNDILSKGDIELEGLDEEEDKDKYYFDLNEEECDFVGLEHEHKEMKEEDEDLMDSEALIEKFTKKLKDYEEVEDRYEKYVEYVENRGLEPVDFYDFEEYFY